MQRDARVHTLQLWQTSGVSRALLNVPQICIPLHPLRTDTYIRQLYTKFVKFSFLVMCLKISFRRPNCRPKADAHEVFKNNINMMIQIIMR